MIFVDDEGIHHSWEHFYSINVIFWDPYPCYGVKMLKATSMEDIQWRDGVQNRLVVSSVPVNDYIVKNHESCNSRLTDGKEVQEGVSEERIHDLDDLRRKL